MTFKRRLEKLEPPPKKPWRALQEKYDLNDPPPGSTDEGKYTLLVCELRQRAVREHFFQRLRFDPELEPVFERKGAERNRLAAAIMTVISWHATRGAPLELPLPIARTFMAYPLSITDPDWPQPLKGQHHAEAEHGKVLGGGTPHDCEECGYVHPVLDVTTVDRTNGQLIIQPGVKPLFTACTLCGGKVGPAAYWTRHQRYPNGRTVALKLGFDHWPEVDYPPECW